ncbi:MAG TPA: AAA family ATPase, partial [Actinomycetota bacterium]
MVKCPRCGEQNADGARFCSRCGASLGLPDAVAAQERKLVSVLFVDLVGFTARSDRADPEDVRDSLQAYYERAKARVTEYGGAVEKFIGDAVMAVFGAPVSHGDDAERAVRAGLRVLDAVRELNNERPDLPLAARAAVTTGEAVVSVGPGHESGDALALGDVVNTASRLQNAAPTGGLIVDWATFGATNRAIRYEELEPIQAKGKRDPVGAWLVLGTAAPVAERPSAATPMVGRDREMGLVRSVWERALTERRPHLITVIGPPGIGKSRLTREVMAQVVGDTGQAAKGRCLPYETRAVYGAFGQQVRQVAVFDEDPPEVVREKLARSAEELVTLDETQELTRSLSVILGLGLDEPLDERILMFFAARRFVEAVASRRPTLFVFEDVHWADSAELDLLEYLASHVRETSAVFLALARPEFLDARPTWGSGLLASTTLALEPLTPTEASTVASNLLESASAERVERLVEIAEGNPLFIEELTSSLVERGDDFTELPTNVRAAIASRIDALPAEARAVLLDASVIGKTFWRGVLGA